MSLGDKVQIETLTEEELIQLARSAPSVIAVYYLLRGDGGDIQDLLEKGKLTKYARSYDNVELSFKYGQERRTAAILKFEGSNEVGEFIDAAELIRQTGLYPIQVLNIKEYYQDSIEGIGLVTKTRWKTYRRKSMREGVYDLSG